MIKSMMTKSKFKQTEIGMIPEDWEVKRLKDVTLQIFSGGTPNTRKEEYWNGNLLWLSSGETRQTFIRDTERKITKFGVDNSSTRLAKKEDVVVAGAGQGHTRGQPSFCLIDTYINQSVVVLRANKGKLIPFFLFYNLLSRYDELRQLSDAQSSRGSLTTKLLADLFVKLPTLEEQEVISKILSDLDFKIELNQQMNKTLEAIGQAIFKHWFVDFDFPNEKGKPYKSSGGEMVDSELGEIPKGWEIGKLPEVAIVTDCLHTKKPKQKYDGDMLLQFYNLTDEHGINISNPYYISKEDYTVWTKNILVKEGDLLFTNAGGQKIARVPYWFKGGIGRNITAVRGNKINVAYLFYYFLSSYGNNQTNKNTDAGTIFSSLNVKGIRNISILIPPKEITDNFSRMASKICSKIETNDINKYNLSQIRDSLLPRLMSGTIRVPVEVRT